MSGSLAETLKMIKIEHSVFALPFALASAFLASGGWPSLEKTVLIVVAMVCARSSAMAFNRFLDADLDAANPRTATRSIPAGRLTRRFALGFTLITAAMFLGVAGMLNRLSLMLAPLMLVVLLGYSATKRFSALCHFILGLALGLAPLGAWVAVTGSFSWLPVVLGLAVLWWTAGFDIIYACQDISFDRAHQLHSIPARLGVTRSLYLARALHLMMMTLLIGFGIECSFSWPYWLGIAAVAACLGYEHSLVWDGSLERVDMAFFTMNGVVSLVFGVTTIAAILLH